MPEARQMHRGIESLPARHADMHAYACLRRSIGWVQSITQGQSFSDFDVNVHNLCKFVEGEAHGTPENGVAETSRNHGDDYRGLGTTGGDVTNGILERTFPAQDSDP